MAKKSKSREKLITTAGKESKRSYFQSSALLGQREKREFYSGSLYILIKESTLGMDTFLTMLILRS
jgi:hypothetical protein